MRVRDCHRTGPGQRFRARFERPAILLGVLLGGMACGPNVLVGDTGAETGDDDDGGTTTDTPPVPGTSTTSPPTATATVSTSSDPTAPPEPVSGTCVPTCQSVEDCCGGAPDCPGDYPDNWTCRDGVCIHGGCASDEDCNSGGFNEDFVCGEYLGGRFCLPKCVAFDDCVPLMGWACTGVSRGGEPYCRPDELCGDPEAGDPCQGYGTCDPETNACRCYADAECQLQGYVCHFD
jgi:hypothetical protein